MKYVNDMKVLPTTKTLLFSCLLLAAFFSCSRTSPDIENIFSQVENIVELRPDSALALLDYIQNPYALDEGQFAEYTLLWVQAKDKADEDISGDSLILRATAYFHKHKEPENLVLSEFYCGRVYQSQGKLKEAAQAYLEAEATSKKIQNDNLKGLIQYFIGDVNYEQGFLDEAIDRYKSAANYFSQENGKFKNFIGSLNSIGNCFLLKHEKDSAFYYYNQGLKLAESQSNLIEAAIIAKNIGIALLKLDDTALAKEQFFNAVNLTSDSSTQSDIYLNLAMVYEKENRPDSVLFFTEWALPQFKEKNNTEKLAIAYRLLSKNEEKLSNYQAGLEYQKKYTRQLSLILAEKREFAILDVQKKYNFELVKNANIELTMEKQRIQVITLCIIICLLITGFILYWKIKKNKSDLFEALQKTYLFEETEENLRNTVDQRNKEFIDLLSQQFDMQLKVKLFESCLSENDKKSGKNLLKKINDIMYGKDKKLDWSLLLQSANKLYDHFPDKLRKLYPKLSDEEIYICCLSKAGLRNSEIAVFFGPIETSANAIQLRKSVIRKKTGMEEKENFVKQLDTIV